MVGIYLSLRGTTYANNSIIFITEIGETNPDTTLNGGLQCITDKKPCCRFSSHKVGEWLFPDGNNVPSFADALTLYRNRGRDDGTVNLNQLNTNITSPTGLYCCKVPDATDVTQLVCVNIGK